METAYEKILEYIAKHMAFNVTEFVITTGLEYEEEILSEPIPHLENLMKKENPNLYKHHQDLKLFAKMIKSVATSGETKVLFRISDLVGFSEVLMNIPLKQKERVDILLKFMEINIKNVEEYNRNIKEHDELVEKLSQDIPPVLMKMLPSFTEDLNKFLDMDKNEFIEVEKQNDVLKRLYFDKIDSYSVEDVESFISVLEYEKFNKQLCESMKAILLKNVEKRKKETITLQVIKENKKIENQLSQKEHKRICYEISKYFDLEEMKAIRPLSLEEIITCTSLLIQLGIKNSEIIKIITIIEKSNKNSNQNPFAKYNEMYDKLKYYGHDEQLTEYVSEIFIVNDEDYEFWKTASQQELDEILKGLPSSYDYELEKAKSFIKM